MAAQMQLNSAMPVLQRLDFRRFEIDTEFVMQSSVNKTHRRNLTELKRGETGELDHIDLQEPEARRLMEMGFVPGHQITAAQSAPGGDPRVFRVDGSEVALRRETARHLFLKK
jgi:ferrous iron transport protein A